VSKQIAGEILKSGDDPLRHVRDFESLWYRSNYAHEISSLGTLRDDVWVAQSAGRSDEEIRLELVSILKTSHSSIVCSGCQPSPFKTGLELGFIPQPLKSPLTVVEVLSWSATCPGHPLAVTAVARYTKHSRCPDH